MNSPTDIVFRLRYILGANPDQNDEVNVTAKAFVTNGDFIDFYSDAARNIHGTLTPSGDIVYRVRADLVADIAVT